MTGQEHPDAPAGKAEKYAQRERERRFLLAALPAEVPIRFAEIHDRYIGGTRLRLRRTTETTAEGASTYRKLTQKIPAPEGSLGLITTIYLSEAEYEVFAVLPAEVIKKTRYSLPPLGVDVFEGRLAGLVIAEIEFADDVAAESFPVPTNAIAEITADPRLTGGKLAVTDRAELLAVLSDYGLSEP